MPIYEFYCRKCNTIFSFLSRKINPAGRPACPKCHAPHLEKQVSIFAAASRAKESGDGERSPDLPVDDAKMERAIDMLTAEAGKINEDDPRQAAGLMRKFSDATGIRFGKDMEDAMNRIASGEDPDKVEAEMGGALDSDPEAFLMPDKPAGRKHGPPAPLRDKTLYEM